MIANIQHDMNEIRTMSDLLKEEIEITVTPDINELSDNDDCEEDTSMLEVPVVGAYYPESKPPELPMICHDGIKPKRKKAKNKTKAQQKSLDDSQKPRFICALCDKSFASKSTIKHHLRGHSGLKPHKCTYCSKCYTNRVSLREHIRTHTGEKPFVCSICQKAFTRRRGFKIHERTHTRQFCDRCKKTFMDDIHLLAHKCNWEKKRPFKCTICPEEFIYKDSLTSHMHKHMGVRPFVCTVCRKEYGIERSLRRHNCHGIPTDDD